MKPSAEELDQFLNALQLSIKSQIIGTLDKDLYGDVLFIGFERVEKDDQQLIDFEKIIPGRWDRYKKTYSLSKPSEINWPLLNSFLLVTRLNQENMIKLAELNKDYSLYVEKLFPEKTKSFRHEITEIGQLTSLVFKGLEKKQMTIRALAEKTGLSQVALSNFKRGGDIKLSNLLKICKVLDLKIHIIPGP